MLSSSIIGLIVTIAALVGAVLTVWLVILALVVGHRYLSYHPRKPFAHTEPAPTPQGSHTARQARFNELRVLSTQRVLDAAEAAELNTLRNSL